MKFAKLELFKDSKCTKSFNTQTDYKNVYKIPSTVIVNSMLKVYIKNTGNTNAYNVKITTSDTKKITTLQTEIQNIKPNEVYPLNIYISNIQKQSSNVEQYIIQIEYDLLP